MERNNLKLSRRDFLKLAGIAGLSLVSACTPRSMGVIADLDPTKTLTPEPSMTPTNTESPTPIPLIETFKFGNFDVAHTPFTTELTPELVDLLGDTDGFGTLHLKNPLPITTPGYGTIEQQKIFEDSSLYPGYVIKTTEDNSLLIITHSLRWDSLGEIARVIGGWDYRNPKRFNEIQGQKVIISPEGQLPISAEIVFIKTMTNDFFNHGDGINKTFGKIPEEGNFTFALTENLGIPASIRNDETPGVYYLTIAGCQGKIPGEKVYPDHRTTSDQAYYINTANTSLVTLKFSSP